MSESELPPAPPTWQRVLRLPRSLARELWWWLSRRWRSLRRRRAGRWAVPVAVGRAWLRTDPHHVQRVFQDLRGSVSEPASAAPPPPGTSATFSGRLSFGSLGWGDLRFDDVAVDDAIVDALGLDERSVGFPAEITVRVLDDPGGGSDHSSRPPRNG
jgi:hypothetical protein